MTKAAVILLRFENHGGFFAGEYSPVEARCGVNRTTETDASSKWAREIQVRAMGKKQGSKGV